jgi:hypothetical protein
MTRVMRMIAIGLVMLMHAQAIAADAVGQATISKRQMVVQVVDCMKKRMSANKAISYNAAAKVCKNQVDNQSSSSESVALVASDSAAKP